jgi:hypothetical protein
MVAFISFLATKGVEGWERRREGFGFKEWDVFEVRGITCIPCLVLGMLSWMRAVKWVSRDECGAEKNFEAGVV